MAIQRTVIHTGFAKPSAGNAGYLVELYTTVFTTPRTVDVHVHKAVEDDAGDVMLAGSSRNDPYLHGSICANGSSRWKVYHMSHKMVEFYTPDDVDELAWLIKECCRVARVVMGWEFASPPSATQPVPSGLSPVPD